MSKASTDGTKLYCGGQEVTKEQFEAAIADYKKKQLLKNIRSSWKNLRTL